MPSKIPALQVYLSNEERERVRVAAAKAKASMSEFAKAATLDEVRRIEQGGDKMSEEQAEYNTGQPSNRDASAERLAEAVLLGADQDPVVAAYALQRDIELRTAALGLILKRMAMEE